MARLLIDKIKECLREPITKAGLVALLAFGGRDLYSNEIRVPKDYIIIQSAINDANDGDEIIVSPGTYYENINFKGKNIVLRSTNPNDSNIVASTIINGMDKSVVNFNSGEDPNCVLSGFTITNGGPYEVYIWFAGGGIVCHHSSPTITHNIIAGNRGMEWGGGIYLREGSSPLIMQNIIMHNSAAISGGGIDCVADSSPAIIGNKIIMNQGDGSAGAINIMYSSPIILYNLIALNYKVGICIGGSGEQTIILNNTIANTLPRGDDPQHFGIEVYGTKPIIRNCILWENGTELEGCTATYSCIKGSYSSIGNISTDPLFADPNNYDYHLKSQAGRWDPNSKTWTLDDVTSPCIDAGDPLSPIGYEQFPNGGRINMGAYGGTLEASKSYFGKPNCETIVAGDINGDCIVNFKDFAIMAYHWLEDRGGE